MSPKEVDERIAQRDAVIAALEPRLEEARAETKAASRELAVQLRYASRIQSVIKGTSEGPFIAAMGALIDADRAALALKGK